MFATTTSVSLSDKIANIITSSEAYREAKVSSKESCCVEKLAGPRYYDFAGGTKRLPDRRYADYLKCPSHRYCITDEITIPRDLLNGPFDHPSPLGFDLPWFIPLVNPLSPRTFAHKYLKNAFPVVAVQSWSLFRSRAGLERAKSKGLNDMLDFDGKVLLSSIMPDKYIVEKGVKWFVNIVKSLNPDIATTWDVPTYSNHPRRSSLNWLLRGLDAAKLMASNLDIPLIGLIAGADLPQVRLSSVCLHELGFEHQALACEQLLRGRQLRFLKACVSTAKMNCSNLTLLSCSHPRLFEKFPLANQFVGMSWFNQAIRGRSLAGTNTGYDRANQGSAQELLCIENLLATIDSHENPQLMMEEALRIG